jgi:hypothetical protein
MGDSVRRRWPKSDDGIVMHKRQFFPPAGNLKYSRDQSEVRCRFVSLDAA